MGYWKDFYTFLNSIEYEFKWAGHYGAKGEKRAPKEKPTPEQIKKQNQKNKEIRMRRILKANFAEEDLWVTLKYPKGTKKALWELIKDVTGFHSQMRYARKKTGRPYKWVCRLEVGKKGGLHTHMVINRVEGEETARLIKDKWKKHGSMYFEYLYETGGFEALAEYIVKPPPEEMEEQLSMFSQEEQKQLVKYSCSRNLIRSKPKRKHYSHWTVRKLLVEGPKPTPGYYIDKNSIVAGVNKYTGMSYLRYTEVRIKPIKRAEWGGG